MENFIDNLKMRINLWPRYKQISALRRLFFDPNGKLKDDAKVVLAWLRNEVNGKGYRYSASGNSMLNGPDGRFDAGAVAYTAGQRRVYDLLIASLAVDETEVFNLAAALDQKREDVLFNDIIQI